MEAERRGWLETLAAACDRVLAQQHLVESPHRFDRALMSDVEELRDRVQAELAAGGGLGKPSARRP